MTDLLTDLRGRPLERADELLDRAAHDVAKYMAMTARNLDPGAVGPGELDHLLGDLRRTDGERPAWRLWSALSRELRELASDPELDGIDRQMTALAAAADRDEPDPAGLISAVLGAADRIVALRRAVRRRRIEAAR